MQIGEFGDWNIKNSNSKLISSKNVTCKEEPPSPRGGKSAKLWNNKKLFDLF